ncbi:DUF6177 family protein [Streptomyces sp. NPDC002851]
MTKDVIALTPKTPDIPVLLAGLYAGGPNLGVETLHDGAAVHLCTPDGSPLVTVDAPVLVQVPGEAARLLGDETPVPEGPVWWTEARATTAVPEAGRLAGSIAGRLAEILDGTTWPTEAATTDVVPLASDTTAIPQPDDALPAVDVLTDRAAVILTERPRIALTTGLSDALRTATTSGRTLQIVTPPHTRLTLPMRAALASSPHRWIVNPNTSDYFDGLTGAELHWQEGRFAPTRTGDGTIPTSPAFTADESATDPGERQLILSLHTCHTPDASLVLGGALETCWQHLTGAPPAGWSTAEPVNLPWSTRQLTDLARTRAQASQPTLAIAVGHPDRPAIATLRITRTQAGVEEDITLALGYSPDEAAPLDAIEVLAAALAAEYGLTSLVTSLRAARRDLTVPPHREAQPIPVSFTIGAKETEQIGASHAGRPPLAIQAVPLGPAQRPAMHYPLGDGTTASTWTDLQTLMTHLKNG